MRLMIFKSYFLHFAEANYRQQFFSAVLSLEG
ncbi:hypothetical protein NMG60_11035423 [Bertholletia excelsa]